MKKRIKRIFIILIFLLVIFIGTKTNTKFYSVSFDRLRIHTPLKLEEVTYVDASFMEKAAYFKTEEQLEKWEVFIEKMNSLVFKKDYYAIASSYNSAIISFKFYGIEERFYIGYKSVESVRNFKFNNYVCTPLEQIEVPFTQKEILE